MLEAKVNPSQAKSRAPSDRGVVCWRSSRGDKNESFQTELNPRSKEAKFYEKEPLQRCLFEDKRHTVAELALDQIDSTDGIDGTDDFSDPIEFSEFNVAVLVRFGLAAALTGFDGQSILSLKVIGC